MIEKDAIRKIGMRKDVGGWQTAQSIRGAQWGT